MIFYFSGTGNSHYAAQKIAKAINDRLVSIPAEMKKKKECYEYDLQENEAIGFVYPVHAWGPPKMVLDFIKLLSLSNYHGNYTFSIATCGGNIGNTMELLRRTLKTKGLSLHSGFSLVMPNNYMIMGDVDSPAEAAEKSAKAEESLKEIVNVIAGRKLGVFLLKKGFLPALRTGMINPLFTKHAMDASKFYADDTCTGCGLCERVCLTGNISVKEKPVWGANCIQCLACINRCPVKAIQYGKGTMKKGRYYHPGISS